MDSDARVDPGSVPGGGSLQPGKFVVAERS